MTCHATVTFSHPIAQGDEAILVGVAQDRAGRPRVMVLPPGAMLERAHDAPPPAQDRPADLSAAQKAWCDGKFGAGARYDAVPQVRERTPAKDAKTMSVETRHALVALGVSRNTAGLLSGHNNGAKRHDRED